MSDEDPVRKVENAGNQHFLLLRKCFLTFQRQLSSNESFFILLSVNTFNLHKYKILLSNRTNPLPNNKILDESKWKASADNKIKVT